jgi:hypothetical protein
VADDLYTRYLAAEQTWRAHRSGCSTCTDRTHCKTGARLFEAFARLQDAYLQRQKKR